MSLKLNKIKMPNQDPKKRIKNFDEVALGLTEEMALEEANRCLNCKNPSCVKGCPVNIDIPRFINLIKQKKYREAYNVIKENYLLFVGVFALKKFNVKNFVF